MSDLLNIAALYRKLKKKPEGQRLNLFFKGSFKLLSLEQIKEVEAAIEEDHQKTLKYLETAKSNLTND
jgi:hypothetical protein